MTDYREWLGSAVQLALVFGACVLASLVLAVVYALCQSVTWLGFAMTLVFAVGLMTWLRLND